MIHHTLALIYIVIEHAIIRVKHHWRIFLGEVPILLKLQIAKWSRVLHPRWYFFGKAANFDFRFRIFACGCLRYLMINLRLFEFVLNNLRRKWGIIFLIKILEVINFIRGVPENWRGCLFEGITGYSLDT